MSGVPSSVNIYFSDHFDIDAAVIDTYGAFNISLVTDLPLFIDPFLLFNSKKPEYRQLHNDIIRYLVFLRDRAHSADGNRGLIDAWYRFPEVKQNWMGFATSGNVGSGLGGDFAVALRENLDKLFPNFGEEPVTEGSHLEKLCLVRAGVGRDNISDFTTNLIKDHLCRYTQDFARSHLDRRHLKQVSVPKARFNFDTETWEPQSYELPWINGDYVLLTPKDILTRDDTWINKDDLIRNFEDIPAAIPDEVLRAQIDNYFKKILVREKDKEPKRKDIADAARQTILQFPELVDYFIKLKEEQGDIAERLSAGKVRQSYDFYVAQMMALKHALETTTQFYSIPGSTYEEAHERIRYLKDVIENKGGHRLFYVDGEAIQRETDTHIAYRLVWTGSTSTVTTEANDGRGPADFKISRGAKDNTIVEFKLAKNRSLERNLKNQVSIYQAASDAAHAIKVIFYFSDEELQRVQNILTRLDIFGHRDIVLIDARNDNKPSGSKA